MDVVIPTSPRGLNQAFQAINYTQYLTLAGLLVTNVTQPRVKPGKRRQFGLLTKEEKDEQQHPMERFWVRTLKNYIALARFSNFPLFVVG